MANYLPVIQGNVLPSLISFVGNQNQQNFNNVVKAVVPNIISKVKFLSTVNPPFYITGDELAKSLMEEKFEPTSEASKFLKPTIIIESPVFNKAVIAPAGVATEEDFKANKNKAIFIGLAVVVAVGAFSGYVGYKMGKRSR